MANHPISTHNKQQEKNAARLSERPAYYAPEWTRGIIWYQIFPERFRNGDPSNDPSAGRINAPEDWQISNWTGDWYERAEWERSMGSKFTDSVYKRRYGGDLQGILDALDYLQNLGVQALYLNPVFDAVSLHKYDTSYYHHIDRFFGPDPEGDAQMIASEDPQDPSTWQWTAADRLFLELVETVHERKMKIIIDGVFNHTGTDFWAFRDLKEHQKKSAYKDWYKVDFFDNPDDPDAKFTYKGWWDFKSLPELKEVDHTLVKPVREHIFAITRRWMAPDGEPARGIDGWRLDVPEELGKTFWKEWNSLVRSINPEAYTVGEIWTDESGAWVNGDLFTAAMNYPFAEIVQDYMIDQSIPVSDFLGKLQVQAESLPKDAPLAMQNLMDSHDTPRLASMVVNPGREYNKKGKPEYGFNVRKPNAEERRLQKLIALLQFTYPGAPMIYYGTEAGMWGAGDPDDRKPMVWPDMHFDPEKKDPLNRERPVDDNNFDSNLFDWYQKLCTMRSRYRSLQTGRFQVIQCNNKRNTFVFVRISDSSEPVVVAINRSNNTRELHIPLDQVPLADRAKLKNFLTGSAVNISERTVRLYLPPVNGAVLISTRQP